MYNTLFASIRRKTKSEWEQYFKGQLEGVRSYIRENGEKAALLGFIFGILVITFYKLALVLSCLVLISYQVVMIVAEDKAD